jgi:signal transduction histidine kinase
MDSTSTATVDSGKEASRSSPTRWYRLLYVLVAFAVFTLALSLYLSHQYVQIYARSVAVNRAWTERLHECARLGRLAAGVNAPGNDVFQTNQITAEEEKMRAALGLFNARLDAFRAELRENAEGDEVAALADDLRAFRRLMQAMAEEAGRLFAKLRQQRVREAGANMAAMDRYYAGAIQALERLRGDIAAIQIRHFEDQAVAAASLQRFQYVASALILLLLGASVAYGSRLRRQAETATREKEGYIQALRDSEARLDGRVRERTAELVRTNESLRNEIEERRRAETALRRSERRYRALVQVRRHLLKKLISAQEDERRRIARDLHDEIGQSLTSLLIGLRTVADAATLEAARGHANELRRIAASTTEEVRRLARGLRPSVLDDLGLTAALERFAEDYAHAHAVAVEVRAAPDGDRLPEEVETALYRIAQEALTNTAKHAAAKNVRVRLERGPGTVQLTVSDDGRGFARGRPGPGDRLGLSGMRERAVLLNGSVTVESGPGKGTRVTVRIPYGEVNHGDDSHSCGGRPCRPAGRPADAAQRPAGDEGRGGGRGRPRDAEAGPRPEARRADPGPDDAGGRRPDDRADPARVPADPGAGPDDAR